MTGDRDLPLYDHKPAAAGGGAPLERAAVPTRSCETCEHALEDTFADTWCIRMSTPVAEARKKGPINCGPGAALWKAKV